MGEPREATLEALSSDSAVQAITRLALAGHPAIKTDAPALVLPEGSKVECLEYLADAPMRLRATYTTQRISDFCRYVKAEGATDTVVFVQDDGSGAQAIIDYGGHEESDWGAKKSTFASIEATSGQDKPPAGLWFRCKPFADCHEREIDVRLSIRTADEDPTLRMRLVGETALERDVAEEIELDITERLDGMRVFLGTARTAYK